MNNFTHREWDRTVGIGNPPNVIDNEPKVEEKEPEAKPLTPEEEEDLLKKLRVIRGI